VKKIRKLKKKYISKKKLKPLRNELFLQGLMTITILLLFSNTLMIQHTFKSLKTIKSPTACFTVRIIRGKLPKNCETGCRGFYSF